MFRQIQARRRVATIVFRGWNLGTRHAGVRRDHLRNSRRERASDSGSGETAGGRNREVLVHEGKILGREQHAALPAQRAVGR